MLTSFKPTYLFNKNISDYCRKSTEESIRKKTEKYNLEWKNQMLNTTIISNNDNNNPDFKIYTFLLFLSISSISFYFYKRLH